VPILYYTLCFEIRKQMKYMFALIKQKEGCPLSLPDDRTRVNYSCSQFLNWLPQMPTGHLHLDGFESRSAPIQKAPRRVPFVLKCIDNNATVSNSFIWFHSKNETIKREVKLSFRTETTLISLSNWILSNWCLLNNTIYFFRPIPYVRRYSGSAVEAGTSVIEANYDYGNNDYFNQ